MKWNFLLIIGIILCSCESKTIQDDNKGRELFNSSISVIKEFNNKIKYAPDSLSIDSIDILFEKTLTDLNFSFPPLTDLKLTEQENDYLNSLLLEYRENVRSRLMQLGKKRDLSSDSIAHSL